MLDIRNQNPSENDCPPEPEVWCKDGVCYAQIASRFLESRFVITLHGISDIQIAREAALLLSCGVVPNAVVI